MRLLRWASELAVDEAPGRRQVGNAALEALARSPLVDRRDVTLVAHISLSVWTYTDEQR
jgi:hypothetical protein